QAYRNGTTTITVGAGDQSKQITVVVGLVPVGASVSPSVFQLAVDDQVELAGGGVDSAGAVFPGSFAWTSSDASVLAVKSQGILRAVGPGMAVVTVAGSGFTTSTSVSVLADPIQFKQISMGTENTCGLDRDGAMLCWGFGNPIPQPAFPQFRFENISLANG